MALDFSNTPASVWKNPVHWLAFGFGSGAAPVAPGTFGTLAAIPIYLLMRDLPPLIYVLAVLAFFISGVWLCGRTSHDIGVEDHGGIVWDEFAGYLVTMIAAPPGWLWIAVGFVLFRIFDILKPWPIRWIDRQVHGGFGIMLDDLLAGVFAGLVLQAVVWGFSDYL